MNRASLVEVRKMLRDSANSCNVCERFTLSDGKVTGTGFFPVFSFNGEISLKWKPGCEKLYKLCQCQLKVKTFAGIDHEDDNWYSREGNQEA